MTRTTQIIATLFILVAGFTLWNIMASDPEVAPLTSVSAQSESVGDTKTIETLINMRNLRLDDRLFTNPAFQALVNTERQIMREPVGRRNPFSPIGSDTVTDTQQQPSETNTNPQGEDMFAE